MLDDTISAINRCISVVT